MHITQEKYRGETEEEAMAKHFALHSEDRDRDILLTV